MKFKSILAFRELKKYRFGQGDIYFICLMEPISDEVEPKIDIQMKDEIKFAKWMSIDDLKHLGFTKSIQNLCGVLRKLENRDDVKSEFEMTGFTGEDFRMMKTENTMYSPYRQLGKIRAKL